MLFLCFCEAHMKRKMKKEKNKEGCRVFVVYVCLLVCLGSIPCGTQIIPGQPEGLYGTSYEVLWINPSFAAFEAIV